MSSPKATSAGFTISSALSSRNKFPVTEIDINELENHPENHVYSMDENGIEALAASIKANGLTDIPCVRKLDDGRFQIISGHRRRAAYKLLSKEDPRYAKMPCRVIKDISDSEALIKLHSANYFTRALSITERAAATKSLGLEVENLRASNPELSGVRTEDIKSQLIYDQTGKRVSGKTIRREELLSELIQQSLSSNWKDLANKDKLTPPCIKKLAQLSSNEQESLFNKLDPELTTKREISGFVSSHLAGANQTDQQLAKALQALKSYAKKSIQPLNDADTNALSEISSVIDGIKTSHGLL